MNNEISDSEWFHSPKSRWAIEVSWRCPVFNELGYAKFENETHAKAYERFVRNMWRNALIIRKDVQREMSTYRITSK